METTEAIQNHETWLQDRKARLDEILQNGTETELLEFISETQEKPSQLHW